MKYAAMVLSLSLLVSAALLRARHLPPIQAANRKRYPGQALSLR